jgi:hypothetical protein
MTPASGESDAAPTNLARGAAPPTLFLVLALLGRLPDFFFHYRNWDEAVLGAQAWAMTQGEALYRDIFQIHPPLNVVYFVPFFWFLEPDQVPHAVKIVNALVAALCAWTLFVIVRRWLRDVPVAFAAATVFVYLTSDLIPWHMSTHGEFLSILPLSLSLWLVLRRGSTLDDYCIGALWAAAFWIKQVALLDCLLLLVALILVRREERPYRALARVAGGFAGLSVVVSTWLAATGAFGEAAFSIFLRSTMNYVGGATTRWSWAPWQALWLEMRPFCIAALCGVPLLFVRRREVGPARSLYLASIVWIVVVLLALSSAGRFYPQYLLQMLLPLAAAACAILVVLPAAIRRFAAASVVAALAVVMTNHTVTALRALALEGWQPRPVREARAVAAIVRSATRPGDRIFLYRVEHLDVYFLAERLSANGIYMYYDMASEHMHDLELTRTKLLELQTRPPSAIVASRTLLDGFESIDGVLWPLVERCYRRTAVVEAIEIFTLAEPADPARRDPACGPARVEGALDA